MSITLDNLDQYGIGHNFSDPIYPQDFEGIAYGADLEDNMVTVDANHPLAGKDLTFDVTIEDVRDATDDEIAHGHVHGEGCSH